jgi:hypothetical protein
MSGYRADNWMSVYNSVSQTTAIQDYEMVFVGPNEPSKEFLSLPNVSFVKDKGCPTRCYQLGLLHSRGEYVVWVADDGIFSPTLAIDKAFDVMPGHPKGIVSFKYYEAPLDCDKFNKKSHKRRLAQMRVEKQFLESDNYWHMYGHLMKDLPYIPNHYVLLMIALMRRDYLMEIGGFDCQYEQPGIGCHDLAVRLQNDGAEVILGEKIMDLSNSPSEHGPIDRAHFENDLPLMKSMYSNPEFANRTKIPVNNWEQSPAVWGRRFTESK